MKRNPPPPPPGPPRRSIVDDDDELPPPDDDDDELPPPDDDEEPPPPDDDDGFSPPPPEDDEDGGELPPDDSLPLPDEEDFGDEGPVEEEFGDGDEPPPPDDDVFDEDELPGDIDDLDGGPPLDDLDAEPEEEDSMPPLPEDDLPEDDLPEDDLPLDDLDDLEPPLPSPEPPARPKPTFVLPVRRTGSVTIVEPESAAPPASLPAADLQALTAGLVLRGPPQLVRRSLASSQSTTTTPTTRPSLLSGGLISSHTPSFASPPSTASSLPPLPTSPPPSTGSPGEAEVRRKALEEGYLECLGKFSEDPFETLYVKVSREDKSMSVLVCTGDVLVFDLTSRAFLFEDTAEPCTIVLDYRGNIMIFKFPATETLISFMKHMPEEVFLAPELPAEDSPADKDKDRKAARKGPSASALSPGKAGGGHAAGKASSGPKIDHVKGTSVEDILENDFDVSASRQGELHTMFQVRENITMVYPPAPLRRRELVESHIRKPRYSVRRVTLLCEWLNSLHLWPDHVSILTLHRHMCNGLLLARLVRHLNPDVAFVHLNEKPLAKKAALDNLDQALGHIWRSKSLNNSRIPSALDIYDGRTNKTAVLVNELFAVYVARDLFRQALKVLKWFNAVLRQYSRPLPAYVFEEGDLSAVWPHFQSGTALFCVFYHFFGPVVVGQGDRAVRIDPLQVCGDPSSICDYRDNLVYVFSLMEALHIDVLWTVEDWISYPDTEFILLQLGLVYDQLKLKQCSLPPAQGQTAGITSGLNGELLVVGLCFKDAPLNSKYLPRTHKAVLLGYDRDSMPLLPIAKTVKNPRFVAHGIIPQGMTHNGARLVNGTGLPASTALPSMAETKSRLSPKDGPKESKHKGWNARTTVRTERDTFEGMAVVSLLRAQHHRVSAGNNGSTLAAGASTALLNTSGGEGILDGNAALSTCRRSALQRQSGLSQGGNSFATAAAAAAAGAGPSSPTSRAVEEVQKEVDALLSALFAENAVAQQTLQQQEETLASKYLDLESNAHLYTAADYEITLQRIEQERIEYENERQRVEDYFNRKVALIQARRDDAYRRDYNNQRKAFADLAQSVRGGGLSMAELSPSKPTSTPAAGRSEALSSRRSPRPKDTQTAEEKERGWIRLSSAKLDTHNYHLRTKQLESSQAFLSKITPRKLLHKTQRGGTPSATSSAIATATALSAPGEAEDDLAATYRASRPAGSAPAEEVIADAFQRFKQRLHIHTTRWNAARNRHRASLADYVHSSPKPAPEHAHIALPDKAFQPVVMSKEEVLYAQRLRAEELPLMHYEDERRRIVLAEASLQVHLQEPVAHPVGGAGGGYPHPGGGGGGWGGNGGGGGSSSPLPQSPSLYRASSSPRSPSPAALGHQPSAVEIDAAYRFLSASRPLIICDRVPKEYVFQLVDDRRGAADRRTAHTGFLASILEWKEFSAYTSQEVLAGSIVLEDIAALVPTVDHEVFAIHLHEGARALKNAKGRTQVVLRCAGASDCLKYINALTILLAVR